MSQETLLIGPRVAFRIVPMGEMQDESIYEVNSNSIIEIVRLFGEVRWKEMNSQYHIFHMILAGVFFTALVGLKLTMDCMRRVERQTLGRSSSFMVR